MSAEEPLFTMLEIIEQQQTSIAAEAAALTALREQLQGLLSQLKAVAVASASSAAEQAVQELMAGAAAPVVRQLNQVAAEASQVESRLRRASMGVTWQHLSMVAAGCAALVLAVWVAVAWQRQELTQIQDQKSVLQAEITLMQKTADELAAKGGRMKFSVCGNDKRRCAQVNMGMGTFAKGARIT